MAPSSSSRATRRVAPQPLLAAALLLLLAALAPTARAQSADLSYGLMLDAGSSGTRIYIFTWLPTVNQQPFPDINTAPIGQVQWSLKKSPGLSSVVPSGVAAHLQPLLDYALSKIPAASVATTPVYLKATAGMRLVSNDMRSAIMQSVRTYLASQPFKFQPNWAQVISGEEEGVTGWVTVNSLSKSMDWPKPLGALDLGGASMQITYQVDEPPLSSYFDLRLNQRRFPLYTHSYLNYGNDRARDRFHVALANQTGPVTYSPCFYSGYSANVSANGTQLGTFNGTSDHAACRMGVRSALMPAGYCPAEPCAIASTYQPALQGGMFYAFSNFYYTASFFGCAGVQPLSCLANAAAANCTGMTWAAAQAANPGVAAQFLSGYCFSAAYILELLSAMGFTLDTQLNFVLSINNVEVGWALGAMTYEVGAWAPQCPTCNPNVNIIMSNMFEGMANCN